MPVSLLQETYPSSPPVWFAESEETSVTNAVQILSNTNGRDNHVINQVSTYGRFRNLLPVNWQSQTKSLQVGILLRELCRLHNVPLPPDIDNLALPLQTPPPSASPLRCEQRPGGGGAGAVADPTATRRPIRIRRRSRIPSARANRRARAMRTCRWKWMMYAVQARWALGVKLSAIKLFVGLERVRCNFVVIYI